MSVSAFIASTCRVFNDYRPGGYAPRIVAMLMPSSKWFSEYSFNDLPSAAISAAPETNPASSSFARCKYSSCRLIDTRRASSETCNGPPDSSARIFNRGSLPSAASWAARETSGSFSCMLRTEGRAASFPTAQDAGQWLQGVQGVRDPGPGSHRGPPGRASAPCAAGPPQCRSPQVKAAAGSESAPWCP